MGLKFVEIEHKYIVSDKFDRNKFFATLKSLKPTKTYQVDVVDTYYAIGRELRFVLRHRRDQRAEQFTAKSLERDPEKRLEVNLELALQKKSQREAVEKILGLMGRIRSAQIKKTVQVFYFKDCEVVWYRATCGRRKINCVEFEASKKTTLNSARRIIERYESATGFAGKPREVRSLVEILIGWAGLH